MAQLTKFVQQNQASLNRVLLAEEKAWWVSWGLRCCQAGGPLMSHSGGGRSDRLSREGPCLP